jgi:hypothetical protein
MSKKNRENESSVRPKPKRKLAAGGAGAARWETGAGTAAHAAGGSEAQSMLLSYWCASR